MSNVFFTIGNTSYQLEAIAFAEYFPSNPEKEGSQSGLVLHMKSGEKTNLFGRKADILWDAIKSSSLTLF